MPTESIVDKTIKIDSSPQVVWNVLTNMTKLWIGEPEQKTEVITNWKIGSTIFINGVFNDMYYKNKGIILQFEPEKCLKYSFWTTISEIPDISENYSIIEFSLSTEENKTILNLKQSNFPNEIIYKHSNFYWNTIISRIKKMSENKKSSK